ncbi:MAG: hypothetical protein WC058_12095 [Phycisphaeraceae bacterium]
MNQQHTALNNPPTALLLGRIIWAAMSLSCIIVGAMMFSMMRGDGLHTESPPERLEAGIILAVVSIPAAFIMRGRIFKRGWMGDVVTPAAFLYGTLVSCAVCEGAFTIAMMFTFVNHFSPGFWMAPAVAFAGLLLLWPNGRAMFPPRSKPADNSYHFKQ